MRRKNVITPNCQRDNTEFCYFSTAGEYLDDKPTWAGEELIWKRNEKKIERERKEMMRKEKK